MTTNRRLEFIAQAALGKEPATREEWSELRNGLREFVESGTEDLNAGVFIRLPASSRLSYSRRDAERIRIELRDLLMGLVDRRERDYVAIGPRIDFEELGVSLVRAAQKPVRGESEGTLSEFVTGTPRDLFFYLTLRLLRRYGSGRLRRCGAQLPFDPKHRCGRVFFKFGRREFCSSACQKRVHMKAYRG